MTIIEASGVLFDWFRGNDAFCPEEDFGKLNFGETKVSDDMKREMAAIQASLAEMCTHEVLSFSTIAEKNFYILKKPLDSYDQTLEVDYHTANLVSQTLNKLCGRLDGFAENADPMELKVKDIRNLAGIVGALMPEIDSDDNDLII